MSRAGLVSLALLTGLLAGIGGASIGGMAVLQGAWPTLEPSLPVPRPDVLDLAHIHEDLVSRWVVAGARNRGAEFSALEAATSPDAVLAQRLAAVAAAGHAADAEALHEAIGGWNEALTAMGQPWRMEGALAGNGGLWLTTYHVIASAKATIGDLAVPVEVRKRADDTNLLEPGLGRMHDRHASVAVHLDRVIAFSLDRIWPMLDPELSSELDPLSRAFAPEIRAELSALLPAEASLALRETAEDRFWMLKVFSQQGARAERCARQRFVRILPWQGFGSREMAQLRAGTEPDAVPCAPLTDTEALVFAVRSAELRRVPDLEPALQGLVSVVARVVAIHEARHARDEGNLTCIDCPTSLPEPHEASAYAATFAHPDAPATAMFQACAVEGASLEATVAFVVAKMGGSCVLGPPIDLRDRGSLLERTVFGRTETIKLVDFPDHLPIAFEAGS